MRNLRDLEVPAHDLAHIPQSKPQIPIDPIPLYSFVDRHPLTLSFFVMTPTSRMAEQAALALKTISSNVARDEKERANGFLETFQKSVSLSVSSIDILSLDADTNLAYSRIRGL